MRKTKAALYAGTVTFALMGVLPARQATAQVAAPAPASHVGTDAIAIQCGDAIKLRAPL